jgi:hypothetical protein
MLQAAALGAVQASVYADVHPEQPLLENARMSWEVHGQCVIDDLAFP